VVNAWFLAAAGAWTILLVGQNWHPFDFQLTSEIVTQRLTRISLIPFAFSYWYASYLVSPLQAIHETLLKFVLAVPLGLLLRLAWPLVGGRHARLRRAAITVAAAIVLIGIELGQIFLPMRFPDVTDVLIGTIGALVGDVTARALAARRQPTSDRIRTHPPALDAPSAQLSRTTSLLDKPSMTQP
jgi:glycopeptide antibiotics resistance protein